MGLSIVRSSCEEPHENMSSKKRSSNKNENNQKSGVHYSPNHMQSVPKVEVQFDVIQLLDDSQHKFCTNICNQK